MIIVVVFITTTVFVTHFPCRATCPGRGSRRNNTREAWSPGESPTHQRTRRPACARHRATAACGKWTRSPRDTAGSWYRTAPDWWARWRARTFPRSAPRSGTHDWSPCSPGYSAASRKVRRIVLGLARRAGSEWQTDDDGVGEGKAEGVGGGELAWAFISFICCCYYTFLIVLGGVSTLQAPLFL